MRGDPSVQILQTFKEKSGNIKNNFIADKLIKLGEINKFLERHKLLNLTQEEIDDLNNFLSSKETGEVEHLILSLLLFYECPLHIFCRFSVQISNFSF